MKCRSTQLKGSIMPLHTTDYPGVRAEHVAQHEEMRVWRETGDEKLADEAGARAYSEALRLFSGDNQIAPTNSFLVFGYDDMCCDFEYQFKTFFRAARAFIRLDRAGMNTVFMTGISPKVDYKLQELSHRR